MNILEILVQLRDDIKAWVTNNLNALNAKIDEKTILIDNKLDSTSMNPVQNKVIANAISNIPRFSGDYNDLTNAPNITEDDSGNMIIADENGNIIFKADTDGIHTTALSLNGESAATELYVDKAISEIDFPVTDLNDYYTKSEIDDSIDVAIDATKHELSESIISESTEWKVVDEAGNIIFSVDASGAHTTELILNGESAATEEYVNSAIDNIEFPTTDLTGYATETYVTNAVNNIKIPEVNLAGYATETYVDGKVADLVDSAPEALNTLGELATALENHEDAYDALLEVVGNKATNTDLENLKSELSESIVSESNEWKVVDSNGNIVMSVDNTGVNTVDVLIDGISLQDTIANKQDKITGNQGQVVSFDSNGNAVAQDGVGNNVAGDSFSVTVGSTTVNVTAKTGAEIFNNYDENKAIGQYSHAEGSDTLSYGNYSHAEGQNTFASGDCSHVEGRNTKAGYCSHAEGDGTVASNFQHVQGSYNVSDGEGNYIHIVGNGSSDSSRSNAHTLDHDGVAWFAGDVYVGSTSGTDMDSGSVKLQRSITGDQGQLVGFDADGNAVAQDLITIADIDAICGATILMLNEVSF